MRRSSSSPAQDQRPRLLGRRPHGRGDQLLVQAEDDPVDPVENSLVYHAALRKAGVPAEMHLYVKGGHAFGLRRTQMPITEWPAVVEHWLATIGVISR